jgi:acyl-CoA synthetase (AMP-forming)/AMP-acid ligase II
VSGREIASFEVENSQPIALADVPDHVIEAFLAVEDNEFWVHQGVNVRSLFRATLSNFATEGPIQGASTQYKPGDVFFCTADIGWITGHSYIIYGPLSAGATSLMFEGIPTYPDAGRFWDIVDKYKVNILYTAPTAIRSLMSYGLDALKGKDLSSLKVLGTVGEPINEEAWHMYDENIGKKNCHVVYTWWQTETGGVLISNLAGITPSRPGWSTLPMPGVQPVLMDEHGNEIEAPSQPSPVGKGLDSARPRDTARNSSYGLIKELSKQQKDNLTPEENMLWQRLRNHQIGYHIRRQHIIDEYIVDFVSLKKKLTIEVDGGYHNTAEQKLYDNARTVFLRGLGYEEIRFTNDEIKLNIDSVVDIIKQKLDNKPDAGEVPPTGGDLEGAVISGNLCIKSPWPGMLRTTYGDHERCRQNYFVAYPGLYFTGDGCQRDEQGFYRITGRVDDVLNVSGHRIGTAEVENAIDMHTGVVESAVVGYPHDIKGQGIYAYVIFSNAHDDEDITRKEIAQTVSKIIGAIAKPDKIQFVSGLPKTRSGKIMRCILRKIAEGEMQNLGDTSTLLDPAVVDEIKSGRL